MGDSKRERELDGIEVRESVRQSISSLALHLLSSIRGPRRAKQTAVEAAAAALVRCGGGGGDGCATTRSLARPITKERKNPIFSSGLPGGSRSTVRVREGE